MIRYKMLACDFSTLDTSLFVLLFTRYIFKIVLKAYPILAGIFFYKLLYLIVLLLPEQLVKSLQNVSMENIELTEDIMYR